MKRIIIPVLLMAFCTAALSATAQYRTQTRYLIRLKDKGNSPYTLSNPQAYLSQRSLERRTRYGIAVDSSDLPVTPSYVQALASVPNVTVLNASRWLNQVSIQVSDSNAVAAALDAINRLPFVKASAPIAARMMVEAPLANNKLQEPFAPASARVQDVQDNYYSYGQSLPQIHIHHGEFLHNLGLRGQSMILGIVDAGFSNYLTVSGFDSVRRNGQILETWDFVSRNTNVNDDHTHGTAVFSAIAANLPGQLVGTAPKASFFLYRSEDAATEYPIEEHNWVCAAERVDSAGGDVLSSSLGYNTFSDPRYDHTYADMNGNTTIAAMGADMAVKKGLLVLIAAGNSGADAWKYILTPADADSVVTVGAVDRDSVIGNFSSFGPSSDGQVKPDIASVGVATILQNAAGSITAGWGTSFATPNIAGLVTCLWQGFPELSNMKIADALRQSSHKFTNPDNRMGYGIPDMKKAVMLLLKEFATSSATLNGCKTTLTWTSKDVEAMKYEVERKAPGETTFTKVSERYGTGSSFANHTYTLTDSLANVSQGTVQYRIRQVIDTAAAGTTADYIDTVSVSFSGSCTDPDNNPVDVDARTLLIVPNPAHQSFTLKVGSPSIAADLLIRITDALGRVVMQLNKSKGTGQAAIPVSISHLATGKYYVSVYNKGSLIGTRELLKL